MLLLYVVLIQASKNRNCCPKSITVKNPSVTKTLDIIIYNPPRFQIGTSAVARQKLSSFISSFLVKQEHKDCYHREGLEAPADLFFAYVATASYSFAGRSNAEKHGVYTWCMKITPVLLHPGEL